MADYIISGSAVSTGSFGAINLDGKTVSNLDVGTNYVLSTRYYFGSSTTGVNIRYGSPAGHVGFFNNNTQFFKFHHNYDGRGIVFAGGGPGYASYPAYTFDVDWNTGMANPAHDNLGFYAGGTEYVRINSSGLEVKAGNISGSASSTGSFGVLKATAHQGDLYIQGTSSTAKLKIRPSINTGVSELHFSRYNRDNAGYISYNHTADRMDFYAAGPAKRMDMSYSGVNINQALSVGTTITAGGNILSTSGNISGSASSTGSFGMVKTDSSVVFKNGGGYTAPQSIRASGNVLVFQGGTAGFYFNDDNNANTNMFIGSSGRVSIGHTSAPSNSSRVGIAGNLNVGNGQSTSIVYFENSGTDVYIQGNASKLQFGHVGNTQSVQVTAGGNIVLTDGDVSGSATSTGSFGHIVTNGHIVPTAAESFDLGSETKPFRDLHVSSGSIKMYAGSTEIARIQVSDDDEFEFFSTKGLSAEQKKTFTKAEIRANATPGKFRGGNIGDATNSTGSFAKVGINTTTPNNSLVVKSAGSDDGIKLLESTGGTLATIFQSGDASGYPFFDLHDGVGSSKPTNVKVRINAGSTSWFNGGNVGIGTKTVDNLLHLYHASLPQIKLENSEREFIISSNTGDDLLSFYYAGNNRLQFNTTNQFFPTGNVGIGTITPSTKLHVDGGDLRVSGDQSSIHLRSADYEIATLSNIGSGGASLDQAYFDLLSAGTTKIRFRSDGSHNYINAGNLGIGTTNPGYPLVVNKTESAASDFITNLDLKRTWSGGTSTDRLHGLIFSDFNSVNAGIFVNRYSSGANYNSHLEFYTNGGSSNMTPATALSTPKMVITYNGNVGIGTTGPQIPLHIMGTNSTGLLRLSDTSNSIGLDLGYDDSGNSTAYIYNRYNGHVNSTIQLGFGAIPDTQNVLTIKKSGNVGIGTTAPTSLLDVRAESAAYLTVRSDDSHAILQIAADNDSVQSGNFNPSIRMYTGNSSKYWQIYGNDATTEFKIDYNSSNGFTMDASRNVTIPQNLTVGGTITAQQFVTEYLTETIIATSGSTKFGNTKDDDIHQFTGSINVSGSITLNGSSVTSGGGGGGVTISNNADNRILTGDGSNANAEANLKFDGTKLIVLGAGNDYDITPSSELLTFNGGGNTITTKIKGYDDNGYIEVGDSKFIVSGQNVGIGTTSPGAKLEVNNGNFHVSGSNQRIIVRNDSGVDSFEVGHSTNGAFQSFMQFKDDGGTVRTRFGSGGTPNFFLTGSVGIGTASPSSKLHISGGGIIVEGANDTSPVQALLLKTSAASSQGYLAVEGNSAGAFITGTLANATVLASSASNTALQLGASGTVKMTILGTANGVNHVGIGTTAPVTSGQRTSLHLYGNHYSQNTLLKIESDGPTASAVMQIDSAADRDSAIYFMENGSNKSGIYNDASANALVLKDGDFTDTVWLYGSKVGIGTNNPGCELDIQANAGPQLRLKNLNTTNASELILDGNRTSDLDSGAIVFHNIGDNIALITAYRSGANNSGELRFGTRNAGSLGEHLVIDKTGNVGIGTTNAVEKLTVGVAAVNNTISDVLRITTTGAYDSGGSGGNGGAISFGQFHDTYPNWTVAQIGGTRKGDSWRGGLHFFTNNGSSQTALTEKMTIDGDGKVGIGTTSPTRALTLAGSDFSSTSINLNRSDSGTHNDSAIVFEAESTAATGVALGGFWFKNAVDDTTNAIFRVRTDNNAGTSGRFEFVTGTGLNNNSTPSMVIKGGGNVGIGTTSPDNAKLHVHGNSIVGDGSVSGTTYMEIRGYGAIGKLKAHGHGISTSGATIGDSIMLEAEASAAQGLVLASANSSAPIRFYTNNTLRMTIDSSGDVTFTGKISATSKSFLIDHPTKQNKKLQYASLEGPENGVYVRGKLEGDVIELPDYWVGLVHEDSITVNLTPIGKYQHLYVEDIKDNKVFVKCVGGDVKCFYTIYGERKDIQKLEVEF